MKNLQHIVIPLIIILAATFAVIGLFPSTHKFGGVYLPVDKDEILSHTYSILDELGIQYEGFSLGAKVNLNRSLYRFLQKEYGIRGGNNKMREEFPVYYWDVRYQHQSRIQVGVQTGESEDTQRNEEQKPGDIQFRYDGKGNLIYFSYEKNDTIDPSFLTYNEARYLAEHFLSSYVSLRPDELYIRNEETNIEDRRREHKFEWLTGTTIPELEKKVAVTVNGETVTSMSISYEIPPLPSLTRHETMAAIGASIIYLSIGIVMLVMGIRRIRSYEIGFRYGIILGIMVGLLFAIFFLGQMWDQLQWLLLVPLILGPLFLGGIYVLAWVIGESIVRETWKEKMQSLDLLMKGYLSHSKIGESILRGLAIGVVIAAIALIIIRCADIILPLWYSSVRSEMLESIASLFPGFSILVNSMYGSLYTLVFFFMFLLAVLRQKMKSAVIIILTASIIFAVAHWQPFHSITSGILLTALITIVPMWAAFRYDVLTAFAALFTYSVVDEWMIVLLSGNPWLTQQGMIVGLAFSGLIVISIVSLVTKDRVTDVTTLAPVFERYISERQRLQREIEIAREVQMSFLPKSDPRVPGIDIASRCIPAHEVGGDYYDFIHIDDHLFGVVIGDVSGKGTRASFYMTLTKGILRSTARNVHNPSQLLKEVNRTFYESIERGAFISMVYGIFNLKEKTLTVARAGHNPVILWKSTSANGELINPKGIALGLDRGDIFDSSIQESVIQYNAGDMFIFYTDGFPEAVNKKNEEFGDERLLQAARKYNGLPAEEFINSLITETNEFIGRTPQRDDMTMVVVKVKNSIV